MRLTGTATLESNGRLVSYDLRLQAESYGWLFKSALLLTAILYMSKSSDMAFISHDPGSPGKRPLKRRERERDHIKYTYYDGPITAKGRKQQKTKNGSCDHSDKKNIHCNRFLTFK